MANMRRFVPLAAAACVLAAGGAFNARPAFGQLAARATGGVVASVEPRIAEIMALLSQNKLDEMFLRTPLAAGAARDAIDTERRRLASLLGGAGHYTGYDVVVVQTLGERFVEVYVLAGYENEPIILRFGFYRSSPQAAWQVLRFSVQTDLDHLLDMLPLQRP